MSDTLNRGAGVLEELDEDAELDELDAELELELELGASKLDELATEVRLDDGIELEASEDVAPHETRNKLNEVQSRLDLFI